MPNERILYVCQEITPYLSDSTIGNICRNLPQMMQESGNEIRLFTPRYGNINERRNQLHEVIRLSGMNIIIDDNDHQLIIKVASIPGARLQVYFIDNEDFFQRKSTTRDDDGKFFTDNDERAMFFARGVLETVKKLRWSPTIVHCHGFLSSVVPAYLKRVFKDDPIFARAKIVISVYDDHFTEPFGTNTHTKLKQEGIKPSDTEILNESTYDNIIKFALQFADGVIAVDNLRPEIEQFIKQKNIPLLKHPLDQNYAATYDDFYAQITK